VIEVQTKDGNKERVAGNLTLGMLSSSAVLEGPIKKGKASFLLSGRMSYWDKLYAIVRPSTNNNRVLFGLYDYSAKIHWEITPKDKLYISTYAGRDSFDWTKNKGTQSNISDAPLGTAIDFGLNWGNQTATVRWNRVFSNKLFANTSLIYSHYNFLYSNDIIEVNPVTEENENEETDFQARIQDLGLKTDFDYFLNDEHHLRFGGGYTKHSFTPEQIQIFSSANNFRRDTSVTVSAEEFHLYLEDEFRPTSRLTFNAGLRLSSFQVESKTYQNFEPRLNFAYLFVNDFALKGG
jgi:outer membrane receptor for ferrienterochelin and colicin